MYTKTHPLIHFNWVKVIFSLPFYLFLLGLQMKKKFWRLHINTFPSTVWCKSIQHGAYGAIPLSLFPPQHAKDAIASSYIDMPKGGNQLAIHTQREITSNSVFSHSRSTVEQGRGINWDGMLLNATVDWVNGEKGAQLEKLICHTGYRLSRDPLNYH